ncbi:MAG: hypothetical protein KDI01_11930, partial [Halioglobus sp.]|nr:hypothetical protein [Halioglobus sp.]
VSTFGKRGVKTSQIVDQLGYKVNAIIKSLNKLESAELLIFKGERAYMKDLSDIFFIKRIITIEAKIRDWRKALRQAELNENFASHSYVLLPVEFVNEKIATSFRGNIGLLAQDEKRIVLKKRAKKTKLPGSYFSWMLNEYVGQQQYSRSLKKAYV